MTACSIRIFLPIALSGLIAAGCGNTSDTDATVTGPTPTAVTSTFSGTIGQLASAGHAFSVSTTGPVTISLTAVGPLATMALGVAITTWDGAACTTTAIARTENARAGVTALSGTATPGNYCVTVFDSGNVPEGSTVSYTVSVVHP